MTVRILHLEDDPKDAELILGALQQAGLQVAARRVQTRDEFLAALIEGAADLILVDYNLPGFGGLDALALARGLQPEIPVIVVSGSIGEEVAIETLKGGASDYVLKDRLGRLPAAVARSLREGEERRRFRETRREVDRERERFLLAARASNDAIYDWNLRDGSIWFSDSFYAAYRYAREAQPPDLAWWKARVHPDDAAAVERSLEPVLRGEQAAWTAEYRFRRGDGSFAAVFDRGMLLRDDQSQPDRFIGAMTDLSERKMLEEQLRQSQKMEAIGRLAGGVAHDFNNLLSVILGFGDLALTKLGPADPLRRYLDEIKKAGQRAANLTRQLLTFSRRQVLSPRLLDLNAIVADLDKMLRRLIGEDVDLVTAVAPDLWKTLADPGQIEQVVMNLVVNARDAMPDGGKLTIETGNTRLQGDWVRKFDTAKLGPCVLLSVSDTGCGMDAETQKHLFEPFFTTKAPGRGTGLGLATVYGIVKQSGGAIHVYSEVGKGSVFRVYLPRAQEGAVVEAAPAAAPVPGRGHEVILLVEDEGAVRAMIREVLELDGYVVLDARDADEADRIAADHAGTIDLVLTDMILPGAGGRETAQRIRARRPRVRVLYMSGYTDRGIVRNGALEPGVEFLQKPFTPDGLALKVREVLDQPWAPDGPA